MICVVVDYSGTLLLQTPLGPIPVSGVSLLQGQNNTHSHAHAKPYTVEPLYCRHPWDQSQCPEYRSVLIIGVK